MDKIRTVILKEWAEVFKNKLVLSATLFLPLLFTALPLVILYTARDLGGGATSGDLPSNFTAMCTQDMTPGDCFQYYLVSQFILLFMIMPLIIPINIAAYSIAGEKTTRSLEPLLATPIRTSELLIAKNLAAVIPAVIATWIGYVLFIIGAYIITGGTRLMGSLLDPMWLIAVGIAGPLMAVLSVNFAIMVSSRVSDPRVAEQISAVVILPLMALFFGQVTGFLVLDRNLVIIFTLIMAALDGLLIFIATNIFQREAILTRWK